MAIPDRAQAKAQRTRNRINHSFNGQNLFGDPFAMSTLSIAIIAWIITIAGSISSAADNEAFPRFTWWGIAYQFIIIVILMIFYSYDLINYYKLFLTGSISIAFVYTTNSATNLVYSDGSRKAAASAGVILLSIVNLIWVFYFGGDNASPTNRWIDSFSFNGIKPSPYQSLILKSYRRRSMNHKNGRLPTNNNNNNNTSGYNNNITSLDNNGTSIAANDDGFYQTGPLQHYVSSTALTGFENTEPSSHFNGSIQQLPNYDNNNNNNNTAHHENSQNVNTYMTETSNGNTATSMGDTLGLYSELDDDNFTYTVKALYSYQADDADAYEISFDQGEILKVSDIEGRWWKAKRENGQTGIIPSNYVELIDT
ncbi:osmosensor SHO1 NDAI_0A01470 [Naumovozyma dairenensis CBS 421]|uniref:High osmolarity signaling protein SHO1 n=1 Tax=Naumovozyma dairenensis (strain ATCC 10597 / BCRC 20456 / CBS 421 / NBRC 0211 / NRRL Y-12639) TaxID=1071378 RepID=G0W3B7_NAUDC|nr:hypothetical protein NDAI_0A01470 [Naumovozyma dairenensis CBS 421]CCD22305.1 hypothetical protein NDAI_0A01470 [Naumovozyma dairenensis CBS 421]